LIGATPTLLSQPTSRALRLGVVDRWVLLAGLLVTLPVFVQAPLVHAQPLVATLLTVPLLATGIVLGLSEQPNTARFGALLVGFAGSWLCGSLYWGWCRSHPLWHLPIEALAVPWALGGLGSRWRLAGAFYLASLLGTAATDAAMALTGVMPLWPAVVSAAPGDALPLLQDAARAVLTPSSLVVVLGFALALVWTARMLWQQGPTARVAAATVVTTLGVDALFLALALAAPGLSGLL